MPDWFEQKEKYLNIVFGKNTFSALSMGSSEFLSRIPYSGGTIFSGGSSYLAQDQVKYNQRIFDNSFLVV
ncbi:MAG: hypothetical protein HKO79_02620 [Desulfobacterales bacterium]|nr:hypothetical protein [Desulfobacterales bacterium]